MSDDTKSVRHMVESMAETLRNIRFETNRLITDCECIIEATRSIETADAIGRDEVQVVGVPNPLKAPEVVGANKDGDGGEAYTPRIELDEQ